MIVLLFSYIPHGRWRFNRMARLSSSVRPSPLFDNYDWDFTVVRYNPDGSLDTSFGGTGIVRTPVGTGYDVATSVAIQADGKIVVAGNGFGLSVTIQTERWTLPLTARAKSSLQ